MPDFSNPGDSVANMAAGNAGLNMGTTGSMRDTEYASDDLWGQHDAHFREQYASRPYARADRAYEHYQPAYRYGFDSAQRTQAASGTRSSTTSRAAGTRRAARRRARGTR
jgi:hypothetical protein